MASSLTYKGEEYALKGDGVSDGAIARLATAIKLYTSASTPAKAGTGFTEVANGNGYTTGGISIVVGNWVYTSAPSQIKLANQIWTATGTVSNVAGAYIVDGSNNVLAWWERSGGSVTLSNGDTITTDQLAIRLP